MSDVDDAIAAATASWSRISDTSAAPQRRPAARGKSLGSRIALIGAANGVLLVAAILIAGVATLGAAGALVVVALMIAVTLAIALAPATKGSPRVEKLREVDLRALPSQTDRWLRAQRQALPAPAQHLIDRIGDRLDTLSPQLTRVEAGSEVALDIRRLVGEQLPAFVADYGRVPQSLRRVERNGRTPDAALADGLSVIEREIAAMTTRLAADDFDSLQTRGRYLETKYSGEPPA